LDVLASATTALDAASRAETAASIVQEIQASVGSNQELLDKIDYLFLTFYHEKSNSIMANYAI
jgi:hypothetical protein